MLAKRSQKFNKEVRKTLHKVARNLAFRTSDFKVSLG